MSADGGDQDQGRIFENILTNMREGIMTCDSNGRIVTFNPAASGLLKMGRNEVLEKSFAELFFLDARNDPFNELILKAIYDPKTPHDGEVEYFHGDHRIWLSVTTSLLSDAANRDLGVIVVLSDITERKKAESIREMFGRYVDPRIVESLLDQPETGGERRLMSVAFTDLEGFTRLAEKTTPAALVDFLNEYLTSMSSPISEQRGIVDKYIGDSVMAFWGPPFTSKEDHASAACRAALAQRALLADLRRRFPKLRIDIRCGISTGDLLCGSVGSNSLRNYTVLGDTVNIASRLEAANKAYGTRILVSEETRELAGGDIEAREIDVVRLMGRTRPSRVFELLALAGELSDEVRRLRDRFDAALGTYRSRDWVEARNLFESCIELAPLDRPSRLFFDRVERFLENPPAEDWDGAWRLESK